MKSKSLFTLCFIILHSFFILPVFAQGTAFTYQGRLDNGSGPVTGLYDFTNALYNASSGGAQAGSTITLTAVPVTNGLFTVQLDFDGVFNGTAYWLQMGVRSNSVGSYVALSPRQQLTPTPYAITAENLNGTLLGSQLTGTLPSGLLSGVYGNAVNLNNAGNSFTGSGGGLTGLNATQLTSGTVPDARLSANVALLNRTPQTFTGANFFDRGVGGAGRLIVTGGSSVDTTPFTGLGFQYFNGQGEGAIMSSYNDGYGFLSFYTKPGLGQPITRQMIIDRYGGVAIDQGNYNDGLLNNGNTNGAGLTFGLGSGEGIASKRTAGGNQFGLDFYTGFTNRMSILNSGFVGIGRQTPVTGSDVFAVRSPATPGAYGGMYVETAGTNTLPFYGYAMNSSAIAWTSVNGNDANKWFLYDAGNYLSYAPTSGFFGVNTYSPGQALDVVGEYGVVRGLGNEQAYIGGDGVGNDAQFGSLNPGITVAAVYNAGSSTYMDLYLQNLHVLGNATISSNATISGNATISSNATISGNVTISGLTQIGSGTGTAETPDKGLVIRRVKSTAVGIGNVAARTDKLTLERDGSNAGWRIVNVASPGYTTIAFTGLTSAGATVNFVTSLNTGAAAGTNIVFTDAQNVVSLRGSFGNSFDPSHMTEVSLTRFPTDFFWTGTLTSTFNQ